jgi:type IV pilus assembly protein PilA
VREINMNKKGFTLIELLIVVVIIGILAAIAIPRFGATRERAFVSAMQSDLRNLQTAQEQYYQSENFTYGAITDNQLVDGQGRVLFEASNNVTIATSDIGTTGWAAEATHASLPAGRNACGVSVGTDDSGDDIDNPTVAGTNVGVIACNYDGAAPD